MVDATTFSQIFTPVEGDYALISLRRVLGCVVTSLYKSSSSCTSTDGIIQSAAAFFNVAIVIGGCLLITYSVFTQILSGAAEGETPGGAAAGQFTAARTAIGCLFLLPVAGGFSLAQLLVIQLSVWASAAGDNLWTKVASNISGNGYAATATLVQDDPRLRSMVANAIRIRAAGYVCQSRLNEIANAFNGSNPIVSSEIYDTRTTYTNDGFDAYTGIGNLPAAQQAEDKNVKIKAFVDQTKFYNGSNTICGTVKYTVASKTYNDGVNAGGTSSQIDYQSYNTLRAIVVGSMENGLSNSWLKIDASAQKVAQAIKTRDSATVISSVASGVVEAEGAIQEALKNAISGNGNANAQLSAIVTNYKNEIEKQGWALAVIWQRTGVNISQFFSNSINSISFTTAEPQPIAELLQPMSRSSSTFKLAGSTWQPVVDGYERDMGYLNSFDDLFRGLGQSGATVAPGEIGQVSTSAGVTRAFKYIFDNLTVASANADKWSDPLSKVIELGSFLTGWGLGIMSGGTVIGFASKFIPSGIGELVSQLSSATWFVGATLFGAGFWLGGILPLAPLLYFFGAVISWLVVVLESLIAVPLWTLTHFVPSREPSLLGSARQGYILLMGLLFRPMLIVIGLCGSLLLMFAGFDLLNLLFKSVFALLMPIEGGVVTSMLMCSAAIIVYLVAATVLVTNSCSMISELGDVALRWIDVQVNSLWNARFGAEAMQPINPAGNVAASALRLGGVYRGPGARAGGGPKTTRDGGPKAGNGRGLGLRKSVTAGLRGGSS